MSNTHSQPLFTVVADACTRQLRYTDVNLLPLANAPATRGLTTLEPFEDPKSSYRFNFIVHVSKRRLGTLSMQHVKAVVDRELLSFRYDNATLYREHVADVQRFLSDFELTPANVTSLEIAIDTNEDIYSRFLDCFNQPDRYHYHYSPTTLDKLRVAGDLYRDGTQNFTLYPHIAADKKLKLYDKTKDIAAKGKDYITQYHKLSGLDTTRPVYRIELTLFNSAFKSKTTEYVKADQLLTPHHYKQLSDAEKRGYVERVTETDTTPTIEDLRDTEKLLAIFYKYTSNLKAFSVKNGNTRVARCQPVELLNLGTPAAPVAVDSFADTKKYHIQMTATYKTLIRSFYTTQNEMYLRTAQTLAKDTNTTAELDKQLKALAPLRTLYATIATATVAPRQSLPI